MCGSESVESVVKSAKWEGSHMTALHAAIKKHVLEEYLMILPNDQDII